MVLTLLSDKMNVYHRQQNAVWQFVQEVDVVKKIGGPGNEVAISGDTIFIISDEKGESVFLTMSVRETHV